jgi:hypothetical protein
MQRYKPGALVIYRVAKFSTHPGPRAKDIAPAPKGETYSYEVDKFWVVADSGRDGKVRLRTRRGKEHVVDSDDPRLRPARWWERLMYKSRFPSLTEQIPAGA